MSEQMFDKMFAEEVERAARKSLERERVNALLNKLANAAFVPSAAQTPDNPQETTDPNKSPKP